MHYKYPTKLVGLVQSGPHHDIVESLTHSKSNNNCLIHKQEIVIDRQIKLFVISPFSWIGKR